MGPSDRFAAGELTEAGCAALGRLPTSLEVAPGILACHGEDERYLLDEVEGGRLVRASQARIEEGLGAAARIVLCGHSHRPDLVRLPDGPLIVNPGSVGCPAYHDPAAPAHVSESGSPLARYAIFDRRRWAAAIEHIAVSYPFEEAARRAERNGRMEWAYALRTGFMPPLGQFGAADSSLRLS